jgi:DNA-binding CsgD family transcriptional regulator
MKTIANSFLRWMRSFVYELTSFFVLVVLFAGTLFGLSSGAFLPLAVLIFLGLLTIMEKVATFEIKRANKILRTDFQIVPNWFSSPFFSWDGLKERVSSHRSWMAIVYVFVAFFWSVLGFVLTLIGILGILTLLIGLGAVAFINFSRSFEIVDGADIVNGNIQFKSSILEFNFDNQGDTARLAWSLQAWPAILVSIIVIILSIWLVPKIARASAKLVESLLSGTALPTIEAEFKKRFTKSKISERQVREAMQSQALSKDIEELSNREREILALMAQGKTNAGIAKTLYITEGSVEKHISNILNKLGIDGGDDTHRRVAAVLKYLGLAPSD